MNKIFLMLLFFPMLLFAQIDGAFILKNDQEILLNKALIKFLESQIDTTNGKSKIMSWEGQKKVKIPYTKKFKKDYLTRKITIDKKRYYVQYAKVDTIITVSPFKTKFMEFDFKNGKIKKDKTWKLEDDESFLKPDKNKIKEKLKKIKGKGDN